jgi:predicted Zn-dependent protease with MMP-like domain
VGAAVFVWFAAWVAVSLMGDDLPDADFERLVERSEALAALPAQDRPPSKFDELVIQALDDLPEEFRELLERTPVVVSHRGREHHAYGHYIGVTIARDTYPDRIVIYQDTLERDFGHDPELLRTQVERTVRHELGHHLGWDEQKVRNLGL